MAICLNKIKAFFARQPGEESGSTGFKALYNKELADHFCGKRLLILLLLVAVTGIASVYGALSGIQKILDAKESTFTFLDMFTTSSDSLPISFVAFLSFLGPVIGLALGFDAINGERSRRTLSRLLAQPIHRDAVINAKFFAGVSVLSIVVFSLGLVVTGMGIIATGIPPTLDELLRIVVFLIFTVVYMSFWLAISLFFSLIFRHAATSALSGIALWLFFAVFISLIAGLIAGAIYPVNDNSTTQEQVNNYVCQQDLSRISPTTLYNESATVLLNPNVRTLGVVLSSQVDNAVSGTLPLGQSLLIAWPQLVGLIALTMVFFAISYICFMRQEIRAD